MSVGTNIRRLRKERGMTILDLANDIESDVGNVSRLERGAQGFSEDLIYRIARSLKVTPSALFADDETVEELASLGRVPLVSWVAAGDWNQANDPYAIGDASDS